jgi:putative protein-disulfide isomerase
LKPNAEFDFFKAVQYRFYVENDDPGHERFYKPVCEKLDIPFNQFETLFESEEYVEKVKEDFYKSRNYGIRSFPSLVYQHHNQVSMITTGFASFENMSNKLDMLLGRKAGKLMS